MLDEVVLVPTNAIYRVLDIEVSNVVAKVVAELAFPVRGPEKDVALIVPVSVRTPLPEPGEYFKSVSTKHDWVVDAFDGKNAIYRVLDVVLSNVVAKVVAELAFPVRGPEKVVAVMVPVMDKFPTVELVGEYVRGPWV